jgi:hypothetical protein
LPGKKRVRLKILFYKALILPIIYTNFYSLIRVFEIGPKYIVHTKAIKGTFKFIKSLSKYWEKIYKEYKNSRFNYWVLGQLSIITKAHIELYETWIYTNTWAYILYPVSLFSNKCLLYIYIEIEYTL